MQTRLKQVGDELALVLDRSTWTELGIDAETELEVAIDPMGVHIRPTPDGHRERVLDSARRMMEIHEETFRKLAL
jgi:hypothetical protein